MFLKHIDKEISKNKEENFHRTKQQNDPFSAIEYAEHTETHERSWDLDYTRTRLKLVSYAI